MYETASQYAQWMLQQGIKPGQFLGVYMTNSPEFMILWFACAALGAAPALLNYNLKGEALLHCLGVCETRLLIVSEDCAARIEQTRSDIEARGIRIVLHDRGMVEAVAAMPTEKIPDDARQGVKGKDPFALVYTR